MRGNSLFLSLSREPVVAGFLGSQLLVKPRANLFFFFSSKFSCSRMNVCWALLMHLGLDNFTVHRN